MPDFDGAAEILRAWGAGLTPDADLTVSQWADRHRMLSGRASAEPGRYRTARTPYMAEIMDRLSPGDRIHDLNVVTTGVSQVTTTTEAKLDDTQWEIPEGSEVLVAPMDGSFWSKPSPDKPPFVKVGDTVTVGQTIGLIEVMKTFTPIKATQSGVFKQWALEEGSACQVGQPIAILG